MSKPDPWVVHKFGGSSVADADCFRKVAAILESAPPARLAVVLSACKGVTDALLRLVALAERQDGSYRGELSQLRSRHAAIAQEVLSAAAAEAYLAGFDRDTQDLLGILHAVELTRSAANTVSDLIAGYGEIWSTRLFQRFFEERRRRPGAVQWVDARRVVLVDWGALGPGIQWAESRANLEALLPPDFEGTLVITGFIAVRPARRADDARPQRQRLLRLDLRRAARRRRDPHLDRRRRRAVGRSAPRARCHGDRLAVLQRGDGAGVFRRQGDPSADHGAGGRDAASRSGSATPSRPSKAGTLICAHPDSALPVKGITSIDRVALVNLEGAGMIGVPGTAHRLFGALREEGISVILISQGSSEHSICCAIPQAQAERAADASCARAFARELTEGQIQSVDVDPDLAILAVVGDGMAGTPGVAAQGVQRARHGRRQRARDRAGRLRAQHLGGDRRHATPRARCARCTPASTCRRTRSRSA